MQMASLEWGLRTLPLDTEAPEAQKVSGFTSEPHHRYSVV